MRYCPKCGAGIFNSNLLKCPMCDADLAAESVPSDLLTRPELPTRWAKVLCVILALNAIITIIERTFISFRGTVYYFELSDEYGLHTESMEEFLKSGSYISAIITILAIYGIIKYKKMGPRTVYVLHGWVLSCYITYFMNMYEIANEVGGISIMVPVQLMLHTVLLLVNIKYFKKRKNVYDDIF